MPYKLKYKDWPEERKDRVKQQGKKYRLKNFLKIQERKKRYNEGNKERIANYTKQYRQKPENKIKRNKMLREKWITNENYKLEILIRNRIYRKIRGLRKNSINSLISLTGGSLEEIRKYIESQFSEGMSWSKVLRGEIHLDHIIPIKWFNLSDKLEVKKAFDYRNLQPLWAIDNRKKHCKILSSDWNKFLQNVGIDNLPKSLIGSAHH